MAIVRWDPFRNVATLQDRINRLFEDSFPRSKDIDEDISMCEWKPSVDIYETEEGIVIKAELPGVDKEDVSVEIKNNILTLKGKRFVDKEIDEDKYYRRERCFGIFHRTFTLQNTVLPDKIKARFRNGVLEIEVPKPEEEKPRQISVNVE
jgi:HSP20 family protein